MSAPTRWEKLQTFARRWFRRALGLAIAAVAAVWSFVTLTNLAQHLGFGELSWMFPLCIDALAALGMDYWMTRSPAWRFGRSLALAAIGVSIAGNVADWVLRESTWYTALFGIIPPAALAATLGIMHRNAAGEQALAAWFAAETRYHDGQRAADDAKRKAKDEKRQRTPRQVPPADPPPVGLAAVPDRRELPASDRERLEALQRIAAETGKVPTKRAAMAALGVGSAKAIALTRTVRETVTTETAEISQEDAR
jgi:hypothetical protein